MKLRKPLRSIALTSLGTILMALSGPQSSDAQTTLGKPRLAPEAQLNPLQLKLLRSLGLKIAVPTYVPAEFRLNRVQADVSQSTRVGGIGYTLFYRRYDANASQDFCFAIEATNGGIGDLPDGDRSYPVNSPVFGKTTLESGKYGKVANPTFLSNWLGEAKGPFYRFVGTGVIPGLSNCSNVTVQEAVRVTESLRYVNP